MYACKDCFEKFTQVYFCSHAQPDCVTNNDIVEMDCVLDGYDISQLRVFGQFSYDKDNQRELQFQTEMRELELSARVWEGEESELVEC